MAKLHFYYSTMNAGKSTHLLQANFNYKADGHKTLLLKPAIDDRFGATKIASRIGISEEALSITTEESIFDIVKKHDEENHLEAVFVDEVQFFNSNQILELARVVDELNIVVMAYGLRNNFQGELFEGSQKLIEVANNLSEIKTVCHCGQKATMVLRYDQNGNVCRDGAVIEIGAEDRYVSTCRKHFVEGDIGNTARNGLPHKDGKIHKEMYASIMARILKMNYSEALDYSLENLNDLLNKIKKEKELQEIMLKNSVDSYRTNMLSKSISSLNKCYNKLKHFEK